MEQQLKANSVRIRVLQQENASLSNSLARLKDREEKQRSSDSEIVEMDRSREAAAMGPLDSSSTSSPTSPSSILHHQTLCLSLHQDVEERYMNIRQAARIRSAGTRRRRKWWTDRSGDWNINVTSVFFICMTLTLQWTFGILWMLYELDLQIHAVQQLGWKILLLVNISAQKDAKKSWLTFFKLFRFCQYLHCLYVYIYMGSLLQKWTWIGKSKLINGLISSLCDALLLRVFSFLNKPHYGHLTTKGEYW